MQYRTRQYITGIENNIEKQVKKKIREKVTGCYVGTYRCSPEPAGTRRNKLNPPTLNQRQRQPLDRALAQDSRLCRSPRSRRRFQPHHRR